MNYVGIDIHKAYSVLTGISRARPEAGKGRVNGSTGQSGVSESRSFL
jgi:hypothetical protein